MYCPYCGAKNENDFIFCRSCGAKLSEEFAASGDEIVNDVPVSENDEKAAETVFTEKKTQPNNMIFSIIGLALGVFSSISFASVAGLIMSIKGRKKALENACGEPLSGKNKVAYYLSTAGIPVGIVMTAVAALYWLIYIIWIGLIIFGVGKGGISAAVSALLR